MSRLSRVLSRRVPSRRLAFLLVPLLAMAACGSDTEQGADVLDDRPVSEEAGDLTLESAAATTARRLTAELTGAAQVPGPGHPRGTGSADLSLVVERSEVCFVISVRDVGVPTAAHLHRGSSAVAGDVVLNLAPPPEDGEVESCSAADGVLLEELGGDPASFFVAVHTAAFPRGALRGQLSLQR